MPPHPEPPPLTLKRLLNLYGPLALTFLLMSGSSPFINKGIGRLPDETVGLAAYANVFVICLFLYSPCFAVRDIGIRYIRGRLSYRRVLLFLLGVALVCTSFLVLIALTPLLDGLILRTIMRIPEGLVRPVKQGVLAFLPMPALITLRGVYQAVHIHNESAKWIGIGTAGRFFAIIAFVFAVGVPLELPGAVLGGLALALGIATEMTVCLVTALRGVRFIREEPEGVPAPSYRHLWGFSGPLFLAGATGVFMQPLAIAIVNSALAAKQSAAAFGIVKSFTWFFASTLFAMQAMSLAKADSRANLRRLALFEFVPVTFFSLLILVVILFAPVRAAVFESFFEIDSREILRFVTATLPIALALPLLMAVRSTARGLLLRGGKPSRVLYASQAAVASLLLLYWLAPSANAENGAVVGFTCWMGAMGVEMLILLVGLARIGLDHCVTEGGLATPSSPAPAPAPRS